MEVDAAPGLNLGEIMNEMRQKYEVLAQKNLQEAKEQFERQVILECEQMCSAVPFYRRESMFPFSFSILLSFFSPFFFPLLFLPSFLSSFLSFFAHFSSFLEF